MEENTVYYGDILSHEDIYVIGTLIEKFESGEISYKEMQASLKGQGISIEGKVKSFEANGVKIEPTFAQKMRIANKDYIRNDLTGWYILNGPLFENVSIARDKKMIEVLSYYGNEHDKSICDVLTKKIDDRVYMRSKQG